MTATKLMTAEDFWMMPEVPGTQFELVDGELIEMPTAGAVHNAIMLLLASMIQSHSRQHRLGRTFGDGLGYILRRNPDVVRIPDVSFVRQENVPESGIPVSFWVGRPDLAVEIVSPHDRASAVRAKVRAYIEYGVPLVWICWPATQTISVYAADGSLREKGPDDVLDGEDILPGFTIRVADVFNTDDMG